MDGGDAHLGCFLAMLLSLGGLGIVNLVYLDIFPLIGILISLYDDFKKLCSLIFSQ